MLLWINWLVFKRSTRTQKTMKPNGLINRLKIKVKKDACTCNKTILVSNRNRSSHRWCSAKNMFLEISQNSQENICASVSFSIKLTLAQVFSYEFCKFSKNTFSYRKPLMVASVEILLLILIFQVFFCSQTKPILLRLLVFIRNWFTKATSPRMANW